MHKFSYDHWQKLVDGYILLFSGLYRDDLPDMPYHDWYDQGFRPKRAAQVAIRRAKQEVM